VVGAVYRLNTFPLMHIGVLHMIFNVLALTPLLERFEAEFGTLVTLALFTGRENPPAWLGKQS
jgi:membrane associated rhomboid family serine protease